MLARAGDHLWPWLKVIQPPLEFIFKVGDVPLRFFSGDAESPKAHHLDATQLELIQLNLVFGDANADMLWRIVVEADAAGLAERVVLIGAHSTNNIECWYAIPPLDDSVTFWGDLGTTNKIARGIDLPSAQVSSKKKGKDTKVDDE
jgi:hypothetical protein